MTFLISPITNHNFYNSYQYTKKFNFSTAVMESASQLSCQLPRLTSRKITTIQTLKRYGLKQSEIAAEVGCTRRQVQNAVRPSKSIGSRPSGPKLRLSTEQIDVPEEFVRSSPEGRTMSFLEQSMHINLPTGTAVNC